MKNAETRYCFMQVTFLRILYDVIAISEATKRVLIRSIITDSSLLLYDSVPDLARKGEIATKET